MQRKEVNVVEHSEMRSETDLKSKLAKALSIATIRPKSGLADKIFFIIKKGKEGLPWWRSG